MCDHEDEIRRMRRKLDELQAEQQQAMKGIESEIRRATSEIIATLKAVTAEAKALGDEIRALRRDEETATTIEKVLADLGEPQVAGFDRDGTLRSMAIGKCKNVPENAPIIPGDVECVGAVYHYEGGMTAYDRGCYDGMAIYDRGWVKACERSLMPNVTPGDPLTPGDVEYVGDPNYRYEGSTDDYIIYDSGRVKACERSLMPNVTPGETVELNGQRLMVTEIHTNLVFFEPVEDETEG